MDELNELEKVKGKTIKDFSLLTNADGDRVKGFDLIFEDGSQLELYSLTCDKLDERCKDKEIILTECFTGKKLKTKDSSILGGCIAFLFVSKGE